MFGAYAHGGPKPDESTPRPTVAAGTFHEVEAKRNAHSPVLRKVAKEQQGPEALARVMINAARMDRLAQVLLAGDDETRRMSQHFALEVLKEVREGRPVFYTRKVDGFTLFDYFSDPNRYPELSQQALPGKGRDLKKAMTWLYSKGFLHTDVHARNIMFDRDSGKLVLIDMDNPGVAGTQQAQGLFEASKSRLNLVLQF